MQSNSEAPRANPPPNGGPIRLNSVKGYGNRTNNIIYCPPLLRTTNNNNKDDENTALVYFGGDVQDIPEVMEDNRDTKGYVKWNLDNTAVILRESFPRSHILIIRPARLYLISLVDKVNLINFNSFAEWNSQLSVALITLCEAIMLVFQITHRCTTRCNTWKSE